MLSSIFYKSNKMDIVSKVGGGCKVVYIYIIYMFLLLLAVTVMECNNNSYFFHQ